jgi:hypothetical protein
VEQDVEANESSSTLLNVSIILIDVDSALKREGSWVLLVGDADGRIVFKERIS